MIKVLAKPGFRFSRVLRLTAWTFFSLILTGYIGGSIALAFGLTSSPYRDLGPDTPATYGLPYEEVAFPSAAGDKLTLRGWWVPNPSGKGTLILVQGKGCTRACDLPTSKPLWDSGYNLLLFDLRGHGKSDGDHFTFGQKEQWDVVGAVDFVKSQGIARGKIGVMGWSMGAASAIMALSISRDIRALWSDSAYASYPELADEAFTTFTGLPAFFKGGALVAGRLFLDMDVDQSVPEKALKNLGNRHLYLVHGQDDKLVPLQHAYRLKEAAGANAQLWVVPGAIHIGAYDANPAEYLRRVTLFFDKELT